MLNWAKKNFIGTLIESNGYRLHHCEFSRTGEYFLLPHHPPHASTGSLEGNKLSPGGDTMKPIGDRLKGIVSKRMLQVRRAVAWTTLFLELLTGSKIHASS
jgi:hypothetical protein